MGGWAGGGEGVFGWAEDRKWDFQDGENWEKMKKKSKTLASPFNK